MAEKKTTFEENLQRLDEIVSLLESGDAPLEECIKLFEEGVKLSDKCAKSLDEAQKKVKLLTENGEEDFNFNNIN